MLTPEQPFGGLLPAAELAPPAQVLLLGEGGQAGLPVVPGAPGGGDELPVGLRGAAGLQSQERQPTGPLRMLTRAMRAAHSTRRPGDVSIFSTRSRTRPLLAVLDLQLWRSVVRPEQQAQVAEQLPLVREALRLRHPGDVEDEAPV